MGLLKRKYNMTTIVAPFGLLSLSCTNLLLTSQVLKKKKHLCNPSFRDYPY